MKKRGLGIFAAVLLLQISSLSIVLGQASKPLSKEEIKMQKKLNKLVLKEIGINEDRFAGTYEILFPVSFDPMKLRLKTLEGKWSEIGFAASVAYDKTKGFDSQAAKVKLSFDIFLVDIDPEGALTIKVNFLVDAKPMKLSGLTRCCEKVSGRGYSAQRAATEITYEELVTLANAKSVEGRVEIISPNKMKKSREFVFSSLHFAFLRAFLAKVAGLK